MTHITMAEVVSLVLEMKRAYLDRCWAGKGGYRRVLRQV